MLRSLGDWYKAQSPIDQIKDNGYRAVNPDHFPSVLSVLPPQQQPGFDQSKK